MNLLKIKCLNFFIVVFITFSILFTSNLNAQHYFSKSNLLYLKDFSINGGLLVNQANYRDLGFKPNNKALVNVNINAVSIQNFGLDFGFGFRNKSLTGYGNYPRLRLFRNHKSATNPLQNDSKIDFSYFNIDAALKVVFFKKYKLQPFVFIGARYNKILRYSDSLHVYNKFLYSSSTKLNDNYINSFYGLGCSYSINSDFNINVLFENNKDIIFNKQVYYFGNRNKEEVLRFLSYSFQIGIQYTFKKRRI